MSRTLKTIGRAERGRGDSLDPPFVELYLYSIRRIAERTKLLQINNPQIIVILSAIHGMKVKDLLKLDNNQINYYARSDLSVFNKTDMNNELSNFRK